MGLGGQRAALYSLPHPPTLDLAFRLADRRFSLRAAGKEVSEHLVDNHYPRIPEHFLTGTHIGIGIGLSLTTKIEIIEKEEIRC